MASQKYWSKCGPLDYSPPPCKASLMGSSPVFVTVTAFRQSIEDNSRSNENGQRQLIVEVAHCLYTCTLIKNTYLANNWRKHMCLSTATKETDNGNNTMNHKLATFEPTKKEHCIWRNNSIHLI
jgi:hypothetical protein